jgi:ATP synthase protein I
MAPGGDPQWRSLGELASIGMTMVLSTVIGLGAGYWADRWLGTSPWLMLAGLLLGIAAGFVNLFRSAKTAERRMNDSEHD